MAKTSHGTDLQAAVLADPSGDFGTGATVTYTSPSNTIQSGTITALTNSNLFTLSGGTPTGWYAGMSLTVSGTITGFPSGAYIVAIPVAGTFIMSQYTTAAISAVTLSGTNYLTASGNLVTDTAKTWSATTGAQIGSSNIGVAGQWAGKAVTAGTAQTPLTGTLTAPISQTVTVGTSYTATSSAAFGTSSIIGGMLTSGAAQFVVTAFTSSSSITIMCVVGGTLGATPAFTLNYGLFQATVLSNTATILVVDAWKSMALQNTNTSTAIIPFSAVTIAANSPYVINDGGSPSYYMALSQDTTGVTGNEQYLTGSFSTNTLTSATLISGSSYTIVGSSTGWPTTAAGSAGSIIGGTLIVGTSLWQITAVASATSLTATLIVGSATISSGSAYNIFYNAAASGTNYAEQTTNGINRAICTYAHTKGSLGSNTTYTLSKVFTYSGSTATAVNKVGIFNASQGGVMMFTTSLPAVATLAQSGDTLTVTETVTLS